MGTTVTLDQDVAERIKRLRRERDTSLKIIINDALRLGLRGMSVPPDRKNCFALAQLSV